MYATVHWAERKSRRKKQKEGEEDTVPHSLRSNARNRTKRVVWKCFFLFLSPSNLPEKLIFLFFTTLKKKSLKFLPLKTVLSCLGIFLFFSSSSSFRERETTKLFGKIFISFFFFLRSREFRRVVLILIRDNLSKFEKTLESRYYSFALKILMRLLFLSTC